MDDIKLANMFGSSIRIEANIDGVKKVETIMFSSESIADGIDSDLGKYIAEVAIDALNKCKAEKLLNAQTPNTTSN